MISIISDSTCDLPKDLAERYNVGILRLHVVMGEKDYEDGKGITPDEIYAWSDAHNKTPQTSAPSIIEAVELMKPRLKDGGELICFCISEPMSTTGNVMRLAAAELDASDRVTVIDSQNLCCGISLLIIEAALMIEQGLPRQEICEKVEALRPLVRTSFVVDTMTYLRRGGRCNAVVALAGSALRIHPEILLTDGAMHVGKKYRGKMDKVLDKYAHDLKDGLLKAKPDRVFLVHSGCSEELLTSIRTYLEDLHVFQEIITARAGSIISCHCGPSTLGIIYMAEM